MSETTSVSEDLGDGATPAPADTPETQPSLRESMEAAADAIEAREKEQASDGDPKPEGGAEKPADGRVRSPDGKFAAKPAEPETPPAPAAPEIPRPDWLGDKAAVDWNRLPATVKEALAQRATAPDPIRAVAQEFAADIAAVGHPPEALFRSLLVAERELRTNPVEALKWLARSYSVDLSRLAPAQQAGAQPQQAGPGDPQEPQPWQAEIAALRSQLQETRQLTVAQQQAALQRQQVEASQEIQNFAKDRPHFDTVRQDMALLIREGRAKDLAEAYEMAQWAHPASRAALLQEQQQAAEAKRNADAAARVAAARKASGVNVRGSVGSTPAPARSMRETMEATFDSLNG
jgi:hypothetical protein